MRNKNRKIILGIILVLILITVIMAISLLSKSKSSLQSNSTDTTLSKTNSNDNAPKTINKETDIIYGDISDKEVATKEKQMDETKADYTLETTTETVFNTTKDTSTLDSYSLSNPVILENSVFPGMSREIFNSYKGYLFAYTNNNEILYYDPVKKETRSLTKDVTKVFPSFNEPYILFEKKTEKGYTLYRYNFIKNVDGFEDIIVLNSSAVDFGQHKEFNYFSILEQPSTYYYQSIRGSSYAAEEVGFKDVKVDKVQPYLDDLIGYSKADNALYKIIYGNEPKKLFELPKYDDYKYIVDFKVNPFRSDRLVYLASFTDIEGDITGKKVILNGMTVPDLIDVLSMEWVDSESILYTADTSNGELYLYNLKTNNQIILATNVATFSYNPDTKSIDYIQAGDNSAKEITFSSKQQ